LFLFFPPFGVKDVKENNNIMMEVKRKVNGIFVIALMLPIVGVVVIDLNQITESNSMSP
jgi:hypothetical protein